MADKLVIDIFRKKDAEDFTVALADPDGKLEIGSASAQTAAYAAAMLRRASELTLRQDGGNERFAYLRKNAEILRTYMIHLIDEDVKCRAPLRRALQEGIERNIEASRQPASAICEEIIGMMGQCFDFLNEIKDVCPHDALPYVAASAGFALAACETASVHVLNMTAQCSDDTYQYVMRREQEITLQSYREKYNSIIEKTKL